MILSMLFATALLAQDKPAPSGPPQRVRSVLLYGEEKCPRSEDPNEIVVCANVGESPYRIPKQFRDKPDEGAAAQAWTNRVDTVEQVNRAGLPNSCSPIGIQGQTGCTRQMIQQWYQERVNQKAKASRVP